MSDTENEFINILLKEDFEDQLKSMNEEVADDDCDVKINYQKIEGIKNKFYFMMMFIVNPFNEDYFSEDFHGGKNLILEKMKEISEQLEMKSVYQDCMDDIETWEEMLFLDEESFVSMTSSIYDFIPDSEETKTELIKVLKDDSFIIVHITRKILMEVE